MSELFGLSMTYIMIALLCVLAVALGTIGYVLVRNRIMFMVGVRNIPRRRAQTVLIIIGLMLSTLIIATAFSIGDTVEYSITGQAYDRLHSIDEVVQAATDSENDDPFVGAGVVSPLPIPEGQAAQFTESFREIDGVDGALPLLRAPVPVSNTAKGQTEPLAILMGLDTSQMAGFESDLETTGGELVTLDALAANEIYVNESAADKLDTEAGDTLTLYVRGEPHEFTAKAIVKDRVLTGALFGQANGLVLPLDRAQALFAREGEVDMIVVSNEGGVRDGMERSEEITDALNDKMFGTSWQASASKKDFVDSASEVSSFMVTFFVVLGLFSIAAGMMLIFLIFVMLAAERKTEMGMIRAVGTKRSHLVQMFMSEGMVYNVGAAAVGCLLGIGVSIVMIDIMARMFAEFDLSIKFHVTLRSLIVSYSVGVVLTFLTVTFSSWRIGALNIVSAIRDVPDPPAVHERPHGGRGIGGMLRVAKWLVVKPSTWRQWAAGGGILVLVPLQVALVIACFMGAAAMYGTSAAGGVLAVLLGVIGGTLAVSAFVTLLVGLNYIFQAGTMAMVLGALLMIIGLQTGLAAPYAGGITLALLGLALTLVQLGAPNRPVFTTMGILLLVYWLLSAGGQLPPELDGDIELFFLSGISMVLSATFVLVYNADLMLGLFTRLGSVSAGLVPSIRTAVAYPLANKFRTGMTIAMIALVMFALVMMSTMNSNFGALFDDEDAQGGYDIIVTENPANPIADLRAAIEAAPPVSATATPFDPAVISRVDHLSVANSISARVSNATGKQDFKAWPIFGLTPGFIEGNGLKFQARARGFETDAAIWEAMAANPTYAVIDAFAVPGEGFGGDPNAFAVDGIEPTDRTFDPVDLVIRDSATGGTREITLIGVLTTRASGLYSGLFISPEAFAATFERPESTIHFVKLEEGADANAAARGIERTLLAQGVQADSLRQMIEDFRAQNQAFLYLIQGFMGIGLFVGIAAVGVIAFRTVVERRQQIGMLRAIGYSRGAIATSFIMESSFTALLGIISGIALALLLAYQLVNTDEFVPGGVDSFYIPWVQIIGVGTFAFLASLIMTIIPSRQASSIPIAEALRYE